MEGPGHKQAASREPGAKLIVATAHSSPALATDGIDLIDEDDARGLSGQEHLAW